MAGTFLLLAGCTNTNDSGLSATPTSQIEESTSTESSVSSTTTEPETTTSTEQELSDEEQLLELHRQFIVDFHMVDERTDTDADYEERIRWANENLVDPMLTAALDRIEEQRNDDVVEVNDGALSSVADYQIDGDNAVVTDCLSTMDRIIDDTLESRSERTAHQFVDTYAIKVDGEWKIEGATLDGTECDPTRVWEYRPPVSANDRASIVAANKRYFEHLIKIGTDQNYDPIVGAEGIVVDPLLSRNKIVYTEDDQDAVAFGSSLDYALDAVSQRGDKAAVKSCVDYARADAGDDEPANFWEIYLRKENGDWRVEAVFGGGQDSCET